MRSPCFLLYAVLFTASAFSLERQPFDRIYVFGDSYSDIGEGYLDGNGPTAVAYLAQSLGLKLQPSNAPLIADESLDFAVSGAGTGEGKGAKRAGVLLGYGMRNQVDDFSAMVRSKRITFDPQRTLFFIAGGLNDGKLPTTATVTNIKDEFKTLYELGARHFSVALMPVAIPNFSAVGKRLNPALSLIPSELAGALPKADIRLSNWGLYFDEVMNHPRQFGMLNTTDACAGRAIFQQDTTECHTPGAYFYYHAGHPSTAVHKIVGEKLYRELLTKRPLPRSGQ